MSDQAPSPGDEDLDARSDRVARRCLDAVEGVVDGRVGLAIVPFNEGASILAGCTIYLCSVARQPAAS